MQVTLTANTLAEKVHVLRFRQGLTYEGVSIALRDRYGYDASRELVRRIEAGSITADKIDPFLAAHLADLFEVELAEFCPQAVEKIAFAVDVLNRTGKISRTGSRYTPREASMAAHPSGGGPYTTPDPHANSGDRSPLSVAA